MAGGLVHMALVHSSIRDAAQVQTVDDGVAAWADETGRSHSCFVRAIGLGLSARPTR